LAITMQARAKPAKDVLFRDLGGETVLLDTASGSYFGLNEVGARIWALLTGGENVASTLATLEAEYDAPAEKLRADLLALVEELVASGLLVLDQE
jgi:hypothetical protein